MRPVVAVEVDGPSRPREGPPQTVELREQRDNGVDRVVDAAAKGEERADGGDRDHAEDDAVLRHRLTLLARAKGVDPGAERHVGFTSLRGEEVSRSSGVVL